jgi:hypothetical protein
MPMLLPSQAQLSSTCRSPNHQCTCFPRRVAALGAWVLEVWLHPLQVVSPPHPPALMLSLWLGPVVRSWLWSPPWPSPLAPSPWLSSCWSWRGCSGPASRHIPGHACRHVGTCRSVGPVRCARDACGYCLLEQRWWWCCCFCYMAVSWVQSDSRPPRQSMVGEPCNCMCKNPKRFLTPCWSAG